MSVIKLGYGEAQVAVDLQALPSAEIIDIEPVTSEMNPAEMVLKALNNPIGSRSLNELARAKNARSALIVVNDITRPTPYHWILPPIISELEKAGIDDQGITLLVATGIHRPHTSEENQKLYSPEVCKRFKIVSHDCDHETAIIGKLADGTPLELNRLVLEHDLIITTGLIGLHYFAGYSGGRKSVLPGIASRRMISANHAMMVDERCRLDNIEDNPVHKIMVEAARLAGVDFIVNVVTDAHGHLAAVVAGDVLAAWEAGVKISRQLSAVTISQPADIVIASCGGFPKDINLYQAQKALDGAALAVKPGGTIILLAECREGLGEETFAQWIEEATCAQDIEERIKTRFELGGHKAYAISRLTQKTHIILVSSLPDEIVRKCFMIPAVSIEAALETAREQQGSQCRVTVMPHAANVAVRIDR